jgi:hypothetical protein
MKKLLFVALAASALAGCASLPASIPSGPAPIADRTELDERALVGFEAAYKAARSLAEVAADSGQVDAARAAKIAAVDTALYVALGKARAAYDAANAATYRDALAEIAPLAAQLFQLVGGSPR